MRFVESKQCCWTCAFYFSNAYDEEDRKKPAGGWGDYGECRRHSPIIVDVRNDDAAIWPKTDTLDWCGDWKHDGLPDPE